MNWLIDQFEIKVFQLVKYLIVRGYGCDCETSDLDDFPEDYKKPKDVFSNQRCGSCRGREIIDWIDKHIELLRM